jgi:hypothetical protein
LLIKVIIASNGGTVFVVCLGRLVSVWVGEGVSGGIAEGREVEDIYYRERFVRIFCNLK